MSNLQKHLATLAAMLVILATAYVSFVYPLAIGTVLLIGLVLVVYMIIYSLFGSVDGDSYD